MEFIRTNDAVSSYIRLDITTDKKFNLAVKTRCARRKKMIPQGVLGMGVIPLTVLS